MAIRLVGDAVIIGAWLAFVAAFLLYLAPAWAWWQQVTVVVVSAIAGCSIGGAWAARWKGTPVVQRPMRTA